MNKWGSKKRIIWIAVIIILIAFATIGYVIRFRQLNQQYSIGTCEIVQAGESVIVDEIQYTVLSGELITAEEYAKRLNTDMSLLGLDAGEMFPIAQVQLYNGSSEEKSIMNMFESVFLCDLWSNGVDFELTEDVTDVLEAKETKIITVSATMTKSDYQAKKNDSWRLRIMGWPARVEMNIPMSVGENVK